MTEVEIENNFTYHAPSADMLPKFKKLRNKAKELSFLINELVPSSREQSLAQTKLQEVVMWANAGIAIPKNNTKQEEEKRQAIEISNKLDLAYKEMIIKKHEEDLDLAYREIKRLNDKIEKLNKRMKKRK